MILVFCIHSVCSNFHNIRHFIKKKYKLTPAQKSKFNKYVGFIGFENNLKYMTFKLKDTSDAKNTAYRCEQSGKENIITMLNE